MDPAFVIGTANGELAGMALSSDPYAFEDVEDPISQAPTFSDINLKQTHCPWPAMGNDVGSKPIIKTVSICNVCLYLNNNRVVDAFHHLMNPGWSAPLTSSCGWTAKARVHFSGAFMVSLVGWCDPVPSEGWGHGANAPWNSNDVPENQGRIVAISTPHKEWAWAPRRRTGGHHWWVPNSSLLLLAV